MEVILLNCRFDGATVRLNAASLMYQAQSHGFLRGPTATCSMQSAWRVFYTSLTSSQQRSSVSKPRVSFQERGRSARFIASARLAKHETFAPSAQLASTSARRDHTPVDVAAPPRATAQFERLFQNFF